VKQAAAVALLLLAGCGKAEPADKQPLKYLSPLPILFAQQFALEPPSSPVRDALERDYRIEPIAIADKASLGPPGLLLMAQPRAQTAEALVDLDRWVRAGGRVLLLADPRLEWPTERPLGDPGAPPPQFADTGLLRHWGLTLFQPEQGETAGTFDSAKGGPCTVDDGGEVARCVIGKGKATVMADADFLRGDGGPARLSAELRRVATR